MLILALLGFAMPTVMTMEAFADPKRGKNMGKAKDVKAPFGQRRFAKGQDYGRRQGQVRDWQRPRQERRVDWQKGSNALRHYQERGEQAFEAAAQIRQHLRGSQVPQDAPQIQTPPEQMAMRNQWGCEGYMQPSQDSYMWTWPMQYQAR